MGIIEKDVKVDKPAQFIVCDSCGKEVELSKINKQLVEEKWLTFHKGVKQPEYEVNFCSMECAKNWFIKK